MSTYANLSKHTVLVADTGDVELIKQFQDQCLDATTNPSLIMKSASDPRYAHLIDEAVAYATQHGAKMKKSDQAALAIDRVNVNFGVAISKLIPGLVSTEVDARMSFKPKRTANRARRIIKMYEEYGVGRERVLIKIAATWQGIKAAEQLEKEGIHCNLTLLFNLRAQGQACAEAGVTLISPFVGRITDWHKKDQGVSGFTVAEDPGVQSVQDIFNYYKEYGYSTVVMGASFRNKEQVLALAGVDKLTVKPSLLEEMRNTKGKVPLSLGQGIQFGSKKEKRPNPLDDRHFYMRMCRDAMATEKLAEGIRGFVADTVKLEKILKARIAKQSKL